MPNPARALGAFRKVQHSSNLRSVEIGEKPGLRGLHTSETYAKPSSPFHKGSRAVVQTRSGPMGEGATHTVTRQKGELTSLGRATAVGVPSGVAVGGLALADRRDRKKPIKKNMDIIFKKYNENAPNATPGRYVTGALFPGFHGAVAGKPGHKLKAAGLEAVGSIGAAPGAAAATHYAHKSGWYKKPKKKVAKSMDTVSYWGVDHGEEIAKGYRLAALGASLSHAGGQASDAVRFSRPVGAMGRAGGAVSNKASTVKWAAQDKAAGVGNRMATRRMMRKI